MRWIDSSVFFLELVRLLQLTHRGYAWYAVQVSLARTDDDVAVVKAAPSKSLTSHVFMPEIRTRISIADDGKHGCVPEQVPVFHSSKHSGRGP